MSICRRRSISIFLTFAMLASIPAFALGTVQIGGYVFQCQNTCVVNVSASGMSVSDSGGGWVTMYARGRLVPAT